MVGSSFCAPVNTVISIGVVDSYDLFVEVTVFGDLLAGDFNNIAPLSKFRVALVLRLSLFRGIELVLSHNKQGF